MSRIIKSQYALSEKEDKRIIGLRSLTFQTDPEDEEIEDEVQEQGIDIEEIRVQAQLILDQAQQEADKIKQSAENYYTEIQDQINNEKTNWETEKLELIETAKQQGFSQGLNEGKQQGFNEYKTFIKQAQDVVRRSELEYEKHLVNAEFTIVELGIKTAEKILGIKFEENPESFLHLVEKVIREVRDHNNIQVHVHPSYHELLHSHKDELVALFNHPSVELYIYPDDELEETHCIIESSFGRIDASIDSQLNEIKLKLLDLLEGDLEIERS